MVYITTQGPDTARTLFTPSLGGRASSFYGDRSLVPGQWLTPSGTGLTQPGSRRRHVAAACRHGALWRCTASRPSATPLTKASSMRGRSGPVTPPDAQDGGVLCGTMQTLHALGHDRPSESGPSMHGMALSPPPSRSSRHASGCIACRGCEGRQAEDRGALSGEPSCALMRGAKLAGKPLVAPPLPLLPQCGRGVQWRNRRTLRWRNGTPVHDVRSSPVHRLGVR